MESWWCGAREHCATDQNGTSGEARRSCVERGPGVATQPTRLESARCANWPTRVRQRFLGGEDKGTGHSVSACSVGPGHSGSLHVALHVSFNEGQFLVEGSPARPDGGVR